MALPPARRSMVVSLAIAVFVVCVYDIAVLAPRKAASRSPGGGEDALDRSRTERRLLEELARVKADLAALQKSATARGGNSVDAVDASPRVRDLEAQFLARVDAIHTRLDKVEADAPTARQRRPVAGGASASAQRRGVVGAGQDNAALGVDENWRHVNCSATRDDQRLIPRIIMQQWKNRTDARAVMARRVWSRIHPCYKYVMLDNDDIWEYMNTRWPDMIPYLQQASNIGERADLVRYLWMYDHGGVYADLDAYALQSLDPLLGGGRTLVVGLEADFKTEKLRDEWLSGAMQSATLHCFATSKRNPVMWKVVQKVIHRLQNPLDVDRLMEGRTVGDVGTIRTLHRTGPVPFSEVVLQDKRTTVLGVLALQGGHGNGARYYDMMRPESLMQNIPTDVMNPVYAIHINTGTWLSQSDIQGPPDHYQGIEEGECMHENAVLDLQDDAADGASEVWSKAYSLPEGVDARKTALVVRLGGVFIVEGDIPVVTLARPDANFVAAEKKDHLKKRIAAEVAVTVAKLKENPHVSIEHVLFMTLPANAVDWCKGVGPNQQVCAAILRLAWIEEGQYSERFTSAMLSPWPSSGTTFTTMRAHLLTTAAVDNAPDPKTSPSTFILGGVSMCTSVRVCLRRDNLCVDHLSAEFALEGRDGPGVCVGESAAFSVATGDCITGVRVRVRVGAADQNDGCVRQMQFVTRKQVVSPWLGHAFKGAVNETAVTAPRGLCLTSLWGGRSSASASSVLNRVLHLTAESPLHGVVGLGVKFGLPLPVPDPTRSRLCVKDGGSIAGFGRETDPSFSWPLSSPSSSEQARDTLTLTNGRLVTHRAPVGRGGAAVKKFAEVRKGMKEVAAMAHAAVAKDLRTNQGRRFFPRKRGIVFVSGEGLLPGRPSGIHHSMIFAQLNWLYRVVNTTLPTEVWLMTDADYPAGLKLDFPLVTFRVLATTSIRDWYDITLPGNFFAGTLSYCTKILAVLASAFEEVILLDNDNFAMIDPRDMFEHPMYRSSGHLMWADAQPRFINPRTVRMLGLSEDPHEVNIHSDGGQIAMSRRKYLPGLAAMFHVGLNLGETERYFYGDKDLWRLAFMFQHQASTDAAYFVPGQFRHVFNFPSWFGDYDFASKKTGFQRRFHIRGYAQVMSAADKYPAFMHFSGGAKLFLIDMARQGFERNNLWSHFLRITDTGHQIRKDTPAVHDFGWCTESRFVDDDVFPMPLWIQIKMNWLLDRINESMAIYPIAGNLTDFIVKHTITGHYNGCMK